jgi:hypothetical protein
MQTQTGNDTGNDLPHHSLSETGARIGELLRLQVLLDGPCLAHDEIRAYVADRLEALYPLDYHAYRRRWAQLASGKVAGGANWPRFWTRGKAPKPRNGDRC